MNLMVVDRPGPCAHRAEPGRSSGAARSAIIRLQTRAECRGETISLQGPARRERIESGRVSEVFAATGTATVVNCLWGISRAGLRPASKNE